MASETPSSWVGAVLQTVISVWQAMVVPTAVAFFAFYKFRAGRQDSKESQADDGKKEARKDGMSYEQQLQAAVLEAGASERESVRWVVEQLKGLLAEAEADRDKGWAERDRWQHIAAHWHRRNLDCTGELRQARALAAAKGRRLVGAGLMREDEVVSWPELPMVPNIEDVPARQEKQG